MCAGQRGLRHRRADPVPADDAAARLGLASMRPWMAPGGRWGWVRSFRPRASPPPPSLHEPLPHRGLTFGTRTALSPIRLRGDPSSLEDNVVLDRKVRPRWRHRRRQHDGRRASGEELRQRTAPGRKVGARARHPRTSVSPPPTSRAARAASARRASALRGARAPGIATGVAITDGAAGLT